MIGQCVVAILARVILAAAFHFDGNNVLRLMIMGAARLGIKINSFDGRTKLGHK